MGKLLRDASYCHLKIMEVFDLFLSVAANKDCHLKGSRAVAAKWQQQCVQAAMQAGCTHCRWQLLSNLPGFNIKFNTWLTPTVNSCILVKPQYCGCLSLILIKPWHGKISSFFSWRNHGLGRGVLLVSSLEAKSGVACQRSVSSGALKMQNVECWPFSNSKSQALFSETHLTPD